MASQRRAALWIVATLIVGYVLSQFYRGSSGVIGPNLMREVGLSPEVLGLLGGAFFLAFGAAQLPLGIFLDRFGPRRVMSGLLLVAAAGSAVFGMAGDAAGLIAGRALMGLGCAAGLMGSLVLVARWFPADRFGTISGLLIGLGSFGAVAATTPLGYAAETVGWRAAFLVVAVITVMVCALLFLVVRDAPPGHAHHVRRPESLLAVARGLGEVLSNRKIYFVLVMGLISYPSVITVLGLWGGPYLNDVHGLGDVARGNVLAVMAVAMAVGMIACGPLDRLFDSRKRVVLAGGGGSVVVFLVLALVPVLSLWQVTVLFGVMGLLSGYNVAVITHARALFPERLVGRGITTFNTANMGGVFVMQAITGLIVGAFAVPGEAAPTEAYRAVFGFLALVLLAALLVYSRLEDIKPSQAREA